MKYSFKDIVIDSRTGLNPRKNFVLGSGNNAYITIKDIYDGKINISEKTDRVDDDAIQIIKKRSRISVGDVLFVSIGRIGETAIVYEKDDSWDVNESIFIFTLKKELILPEYFCLLFESEDVRNSLTKNSSGSTFKSIKMGQLEKMEFDIPSLQEQRTIVDRIHKTKEIIALRKAELEKLNEFIKARFVEMFGDQRTNSLGIPKGTLKDVADIYLGLTHTPEYVDSGRPFLSVRDISSGAIDFSNCHYITEDEFNSLPKGARPKENDLLFCRVGTIGKPVIIPEGTPEFGTFVSVGFLRKRDNVLNTYLKAWMENEHFMEQVYQNVKGASQVNLNTGWLKEFEILIPSMEKQIEFDNFCKQLDKSKVVVQKALDEAQMLFDSLMQKYFG